jgi:hypothetical protein
MSRKIGVSKIWTAFILLFEASLLVSPSSDLKAQDQLTASELEYEYVSQNFTWPSDVEEDSARVSVLLSFPKFSKESSQGVTDSLNSFIKRRMLAPAFQSHPIYEPEQLADQMIAQYEELLMRVPEYQFPWKLERSIRVILNQSVYLTLHYTEFTYTGGAHPNSWEFYTTFDVASGREVLLSEVLNPEATQEELRKRAEKRFRDLKGIPQNASLKSYGYWFTNNQFSLSKNFGLGPTGIIFYYNNYDIAPYAMGATKLVLPYDTCSDLLKTELIQGFTY